MNPEIEQLIRENNKMLKSLHRSMQTGRVMKAIYWLIILTLGIAAYMYIQPYIDTLLQTYGLIQDQSGQLQTIESNDPAMSDINALIEQINQLTQ